MRCAEALRTIASLRWRVAQGEIDRDLRFNLHGMAIQQIRPVLPLLHCVERRLRKQRMSGNYGQVSNVTALVDDGVDDDRPLNPLSARIRRI